MNRTHSALKSVSLLALLLLCAPAQATDLGTALEMEARAQGAADIEKETVGAASPAAVAPQSSQAKSNAPTAPGPAALDNVPPNFKIGSRLSRSVQKYTGVNLLTEVVAGIVATAAIHHKVGGKVKVRVKTYSLTDLMAGKIKSVQVDVKEPSLKGVDLGEVTLASQNPIWIGRRGLKVPTTLKVRASLSQKQIARALNSPEVSAQLHALKLDMPGLGEQQLEIINPKVEILDDLLTLDAVLVTRGGALSSGLPLTSNT